VIWVRLAFVLLGSYLFLLGVGKAIWNVYSWAVLAELGQRPALVGNNPRVAFAVELATASVGITLGAAGAWL
jgi:hypothetical protein